MVYIFLKQKHTILATTSLGVDAMYIIIKTYFEIYTQLIKYRFYFYKNRVSHFLGTAYMLTSPYYYDNC